MGFPDAPDDEVTFTDRDVAALRGAQVDTILGKLTVRAADNQLVVPNFIARVKDVDGQMRPVVEEVFAPSNAPVPSPLCKL